MRSALALLVLLLVSSCGDDQVIYAPAGQPGALLPDASSDATSGANGDDANGGDATGSGDAEDAPPTNITLAGFPPTHGPCFGATEPCFGAIFTTEFLRPVFPTPDFVSEFAPFMIEVRGASWSGNRPRVQSDAAEFTSTPEDFADFLRPIRQDEWTAEFIAPEPFDRLFEVTLSNFELGGLGDMYIFTFSCDNDTASVHAATANWLSCEGSSSGVVNYSSGPGITDSLLLGDGTFYLYQP